MAPESKTTKKLRKLFVISPDSDDASISKFGYKIFTALLQGHEVECSLGNGQLMGKTFTYIATDEAVSYERN